MYLCKAGIGSNTQFILLPPWETAVPKKPVKEKVKSKAKAEVKAASQPSVVQPVEDANDVSRAEVSKFITALKYKAKNPKDPQAQGAQMVLEDRGLDQHEPIYKYIFIYYVTN